MRRYALLIGVLVLLVVGGGLTTLLSEGGTSGLLPFLQQTSDASASPMQAETWQSEQLFLLIGFIVFNLVGIAATIALVMWFVHRQVKSVQQQDE